MLYANKNFTERQINLISKIGAKNKTRIGKDKTKTLISYSIILIIIIALTWILSLYVDTQQTLILGIGIFLSIMVIFLMMNKVNRLKQLTYKPDFIIGLYYANEDDLVIGRVDKKLSSRRRPRVILIVLFLVISIITSTMYLSFENPDYDELTMVNGLFQSYSYGDDTNNIYFYIDDDYQYRIPGNYTVAMNLDSFLMDVHNGDSVTMFVSGDEVRYVYYIQVEDVVYLDEDIVARALDIQRQRMLIVFIPSIILVISLIVWDPLYRKLYYTKKKQNEIYDLNFTEQEIMNFKLKNTDHENHTQTVYVKTYISNWVFYIFLVLSVIFLGLMVFGLIYWITGEGVAVFVVSLLPLIIWSFSTYATKNIYEILDKDEIHVKRLWKKYIVKIDDIRSISFIYQDIYFFDKNSNILLRTSKERKEIDKIITYLVELPIVFEQKNI